MRWIQQKGILLLVTTQRGLSLHFFTGRINAMNQKGLKKSYTLTVALITRENILQTSVPEKKDFYNLLGKNIHQIQFYQGRTANEGFRKAYRQVVDGV
ncbi:MAG: hypothetical protein CM1200mP28_12280 [Deltaproteobacteria bacterium]|nr:MAG: hypothetical protein CM1200mP28_12280 [Deltaproteobacteria bacterium]